MKFFQAIVNVFCISDANALEALCVNHGLTELVVAGDKPRNYRVIRGELHVAATASALARVAPSAVITEMSDEEYNAA